MLHFPYLGTPYYNRYSRYGYRYPYYTYNNKDNFSTSNTNNFKANSYRRNDTYTAYNNTYNNHSHSKHKFSNKTTNTDIFSKTKNSTDDRNSTIDTNDNDSPLFQIFGINLYFDDILIICLIWFLYDEGVKDESLFISLALLLLS